MGKPHARTFYIWQSLCFFALLLLLPACSESAPAPGLATNTILVAPEFTSYYAAFGGERIFGAPQTNPLVNPDTGQVIQYFQRMRLDFDPSLPAADQVYPFALGEWAYTDSSAAELVAIDPAAPSRMIAGAEYAVAEPFLSLYEAYDGETLFGLPISPRIWQGDIRTQYFENARLEWHPGFPEGERVQVGLLGQAHWLATKPAGFEIAFSASALAGLPSVKLTTAVEFPLLYDDTTQIVHIKAMADQRPVPELALELRLDADTSPIPLGRTNRDGSLHAALPEQPWSAGEWVELTILALNADGDILAEQLVRFRKW